MTTPAWLYLKRWSREETFGTIRLAGRLIETAGSSPGLMWKETERWKKQQVSKLAAAGFTVPVFGSPPYSVHIPIVKTDRLGKGRNFVGALAMTIGAFHDGDVIRAVGIFGEISKRRQIFIFFRQFGITVYITFKL